VGIKILLADDSVTAQNMGKKILSEAGHDVVTVSNGAAAAKKIAEIKPDLVLLDVFMPGYSGLELCERLRNSPDNNKLPVLLTVGRMEPYSAQDGARVRADGVIIKPFEATDLTAAVERLASKTKPSKTLAWKPESKSQQEAAPTEAKNAAKSNSYDETMRLDPAEIAKMLAGKASAPSPTASGLTDPDAEEFNVTPLDRREVRSGNAATPAFAEDLPHASAPHASDAAMAPAFSMEEVSPATKASEDPAPVASVPVASNPDAVVQRFDVEAQEAPVMAAEGLELTAAAPVTEMTVVSESSLEPTLQSADPTMVISKDPALETNAHNAAADFPTQFGTPEPAADPVAAMHHASVNDNVIAGSDAVLDAALRSFAPEAPPAAPPDEFEARLQAAMSAYDEPGIQTEPAIVAEEKFSAPNAVETSQVWAPNSEIGAESVQTVETPEIVVSLGSIEAAASTTPEYFVDSEVTPEFTPVAIEDDTKAHHAMSSPAQDEMSAAYAELVQASVEAVSAAEVTPGHPEKHAVELPESDEAVIQQMREAFSELPIDHPVGQIHGESAPKALAAAATFIPAPTISVPDGFNREVETHIADSLSSAMNAPTSAAETALPIDAGRSDNGDSSHVASAVDHVLQRELPSLVWKIMAELDLRKNGK
jgi:CheY-like chemotaxis protein